MELGDGVIVRVAPPALPVVTSAPPAVGSVHVLPVPGPRGVPGPSGDVAGQVQIVGQAGAALSGHRVVTRRADGLITYASNDDPELVAAPLWLTNGAAADGDDVTVVTFGLVEESSWAWTAGVPLYLGADGVLTQSLPTSAGGAVFLVQVGYAIDPTTVFFNRQPSIVLT